MRFLAPVKGWKLPQPPDAVACNYLSVGKAKYQS